VVIDFVLSKAQNFAKPHPIQYSLDHSDDPETMKEQPEFLQKEKEGFALDIAPTGHQISKPPQTATHSTPSRDPRPSPAATTHSAPHHSPTAPIYNDANSYAVHPTPSFSRPGCSQTERGVGFTASAIGMLDALTSYETIPCNLCDKQQPTQEDQPVWGWVVDIALSLVDSVKSMYSDEANRNSIASVASRLENLQNAKDSLAYHYSNVQTSLAAASNQFAKQVASTPAVTPGGLATGRKVNLVNSRVSFVEPAKETTGRSFSSPRSTIDISPIMSQSGQTATEVDAPGDAPEPLAASSPSPSAGFIADQSVEDPK